jgi:nucleotide-binding universal stress UspA family protein
MFSLAKVLFPVDFSERCAGAARFVVALAARFQSQVTMLHVLPPPHYEFSALEVGGAVLNELFANRAQQVARELEEYLAAELGGISVKRVLLEGDPAKIIVQHAASEGVNLIVMPTHGYGTFRRFILGSVTAKVLHDAGCPVWTGVHLESPPTEGKVTFDRILCAVDLGPESEQALRWASAMAATAGASLTLMHALPAAAAPLEAPDAECLKQARVEAESALRKLAAAAGVKAEILVAGGDTPKAVCGAAAQLRASLLVIGRGSAAGVFGRLRANAYAIIRQSPCPVVSV